MVIISNIALLNTLRIGVDSSVDLNTVIPKFVILINIL
jgi:hypothetical protein